MRSSTWGEKVRTVISSFANVAPSYAHRTFARRSLVLVRINTIDVFFHGGKSGDFSGLADILEKNAKCHIAPWAP